MTVSLPRVQHRSALRRVGLSLPVGGLLVAVFVLFALVPELVASGDPGKLNVAQQFRPPSAEHWLGTDEVWRDLWTRIVHGTRYSLGMALAIVATGAAIRTIYGPPA